MGNIKNIWKRLKAFLKFDLPVNYDSIRELFSEIHTSYQEDYPGWSTRATRRKAISVYWYKYVLRHFLTLLLLGLILYFAINSFHIPRAGELIAIGIMVIIAFGILLFVQYAPYFSTEFLPKLETVVEEYEGRQYEDLEKCRQAQYSNLALILIFYVWNKVGNVNALNSSDQLARLLMKMYGVDNGSLKKNLELIISKPKDLSSRKLKEIEKGFEEAFSFFEALHFEQGVIALKALEARLKSL
jgi:hypothetical protein